MGERWAWALLGLGAVLGYWAGAGTEIRRAEAARALAAELDGYLGPVAGE